MHAILCHLDRPQARGLQCSRNSRSRVFGGKVHKPKTLIPKPKHYEGFRRSIGDPPTFTVKSACGLVGPFLARVREGGGWGVGWGDSDVRD